MGKEYKVKITVESNLSKVIKAVDQDLKRAASSVKNIETLHKATMNTMNFAQRVLVSLGKELGVSAEMLEKFAKFNFLTWLGIEKVVKATEEAAEATKKHTKEQKDNSDETAKDGRLLVGVAQGLATVAYKRAALSAAMSTGTAIMAVAGPIILALAAAWAIYAGAVASVNEYLENHYEAQERLDDLHRSGEAWGMIWDDIKDAVGGALFVVVDWWEAMDDAFNRGLFSLFGLNDYIERADEAAAITKKLGLEWEKNKTILQQLGYKSEDYLTASKDQNKSIEDRIALNLKWLETEEEMVKMNMDHIRDQIRLIHLSKNQTKEDKTKVIILNRQLKALDRQLKATRKQANANAEVIRTVEETIEVVEELINVEKQLALLREKTALDYINFQNELAKLGLDKNDPMAELELEKQYAKAKYDIEAESLENQLALLEEGSDEYKAVLKNYENLNQSYHLSIKINEKRSADLKTKLAEEFAKRQEEIDLSESQRALDAAVDANLAREDDYLKQLELLSEYYDDSYQLKTEAIDKEIALVKEKYGEESLEYQESVNAKAEIDDAYNLQKLENENAINGIIQQNLIEQHEAILEGIMELTDALGQIGLDKIGKFTEEIYLFFQKIKAGTEIGIGDIAQIAAVGMQAIGQVMNFVANEMDATSRAGFERQKKVRQGAAIMTALGGAIQGVLSGLEAYPGLPGIILGAVTGAATLAFGLLQARKIGQMQYGSTGGGGGGSGGAPALTVPTVSNLSGNAENYPSSDTLFKSTLDKDNSDVQKSYVVSEDVTTGAAIDRNVTANAAF